MLKSKLWNYLCVALMAVLMVLQFTGFWTVEGESVSIQGYVWFPSDNQAITTYLADKTGLEAPVNEVVLPAVMVLLTGVAGIAGCLIKADMPFIKLLPILCGVFGIWGFLTRATLQVGSTWVIQLILCIGILITAGLAAYRDIVEER